MQSQLARNCPGEKGKCVAHKFVIAHERARGDRLGLGEVMSFSCHSGDCQVDLDLSSATPQSTAASSITADAYSTTASTRAKRWHRESATESLSASCADPESHDALNEGPGARDARLFDDSG